MHTLKPETMITWLQVVPNEKFDYYNYNIIYTI